ncbi:MAG: Ig-like domain-containing protein [Raineya sp.]|nr:Ig-like domain-containing protein [Raineya sp.]
MQKLWKYSLILFLFPLLMAKAAVPVLQSTNPANSASGIAINATVSLTFDINIIKGTGNITLTPSPSGAAIVVDVNSASVTITGANKTLNITGLTMLENRTYDVTMPSGVVREQAGSNDPFGGITSGTYSFTTVASAPTLSSRTPAHNATNVATTANLTLTFDMDVAKGTGNIEVQAITPAGTTQNIDVTGANVTIASNVVTIANAGFTLNSATLYEVRVPNTAFVASGGATSPAFAGITATNWRFITQGIAPVLSSTVPANNVTNVLTTTTLTLNFDINVKKGSSGNITITPITPSGAAIVKAVTSSDVTIAGNVVTVASLSLSDNTLYEVTIDANAILANNPSSEPYGGLIAGLLRFVTTGNIQVTAPTLTDLCRDNKSFKSLGNIVINEGSVDNFIAGAGQLLILNMPTNFELNPGLGSVSATGGSDITINSFFISNTKIFIIYSITGTSNINTITISGLQVKAGASATTGNITRDVASTAQMDGLAGVSSFASFLSVVSPSVPTLTAGSDTDYCVGDNLATAILTINNPLSFTHKWYSDASLTTLVFTGNSASIGTNLGVSSTVTGSHNFYVVKESPVGCQSTPLLVTINIIANPVIGVSSNDADNEICRFETIEVTFFGTASSYAVTIDGLPVTTQGTVTPVTGGVKFTSNTSLTAGTYTVAATGTLNGCTATTSLNFTIKPLPAITYTSPRTTFGVAESPYILTGGSGTPAGGAGVYSGTGVNSSTSTFNPSVAGIGSHIITYTYTAPNGCTNSTTQTFSVNSGTQPIVGVDPVECTSGGGFIGPLTPSTTLFTGTITPSTSGIPSSSCSYGCVPGDTRYYITTVERLWSSIVNFDGTNFRIDLAQVHAISGGVYPFTFALEIGGCGLSGCYTQLVTINRQPEINQVEYNLNGGPTQTWLPFDAGNPATVPTFCKDGGNLQVNPSILAGTGSGSGSFSYQLRVVAGTYAPASNIINLSTLTAGNAYEVQITYNDANTCNYVVTRRFRIYQDPTLIATYNAGTRLCANATVFDMNTSATSDPTGAYSQTRGQFSIWNSTATNLLYINPLGVNTFSVSFLSAGTYVLRYTYESAVGCQVYSDQTFTVNTLPTPSFTFNAGVGQCANVGTIAVTTVPAMSATGRMYMRKVGNPFFVAQPFNSSSIILPIFTLRVGSYEVYYEYTDGNGCTANSPIQIFTVYPLPSLDFTLTGGTGAGSNQYCRDAGDITLIPSRSNGALVSANGYFRFIKTTAPSNGTIIDLTNGDNIVNIATDLFSVAGLGTYNVAYYYTDENGCINNSAGKPLIINDIPTPDFTGLLSGYCESLISFPLNPLVNGGTPSVPTDGRFGIKQILPTTGTEFFLANGVNDIPVRGTGPLPVLTAGTYEIRYLYTNANGCTASSVVRTFIVRPLPTVNFTMPSSACQDAGNITLTPNPTGGSFTFTKGAFSLALANGDVNVNVNTELFAAAGLGNYSVTYTYTDGNGCTNTSAAQTLTINALPTADFVGLGTSYCVSSADVTLTPLPATGGTFRIRRTLPSATAFESFSGIFKPSAPLPSSPLPGSPTLADRNSKAGTYEITYTYTDGNGCANTSVVKTVVVNTLPDVDFVFQGGVSTYCVDATNINMTPSRANGTLIATDGFFTISRTSPTFNLILSNGINNFNPSTQLTPGVGTYNVTYTYTDANGCVNISPAKTLTIVPLPTPSITGFSASYCVGAGAFALTPLPAAGGIFRIRRVSPSITTFEVFSGTFNPSAPLPSDPLPGSPTLADRNSKAGIYEVTYTYTDGNGCSNTSNSIQIILNPLPDVSFTFQGGVSAYCEDAISVTLNPTRANGSIVPANGFFTISRITPAFTLNLAAGDNNFNPSTELLPAPNRVGPYEITYTYTDENGCVNTSPAQSLTINALPNLTITGFASNYCVSDGPVTLEGRNGGALVSGGQFQIRRTLPSASAFEPLFSSTFRPSAPLPSSPLGSNPTLVDKNSKAGTYEVTYTYTDGNGCINTSAPITIVVNPLPVVTFLFPNSDKDNYCQDQGVISLIPQLDGGAGVIIPNRGFFTITKTTSPTMILVMLSGDNTVDITTDLFAIGGVGNYDVTYTYTDPITNCQNVSPSRTLTINPLPILTFTYPPDFVNGGEDNTYCENTTSLTLNPDWSNRGVNTFIPSSGFFRFTKGTFVYNAPAGVNTINPNINLVQGGGSYGIYQVTYHYTDANGCTNASPAKELRIYPLPQIGSGLPPVAFSYTNACLGDITQFSANITLPTIDANDDITKIEWDFGDGTIRSYEGATLSQGYNVTHTYSIAITYQAKLTVFTLQGCSRTFIRNVRIGAIPVAGFTASRFCQGETVRFISTSTIAPTDSIATVIWRFGDGMQQIIDIYGSLPTVLSPNTQHLYSTPGEYEVELITISTLGCTNTIKKQIFIFPNVTVTPTTPYNENFETSSGGWLANGTTGGTPKLYSWTNRETDGVKMPLGNSSIAWIARMKDSTKYMNNEQSYVESPCFDISSLQRPMLQLRIFYDTDQGGDGAVVQVSKDDGITWNVLGSVGEGVEWYNTSGIAGLPGGQGLKGWSGRAMSNWVYARYPLDLYRGEPKLRFRVAFGSNADNVTAAPFDGFAFDEVFIGERNRRVLIEHFTNSSDATSNSENDAINNFSGVLNGEAVHVQYHTSFPGTDPMNADNTADPSARALYYGVSQVPRTSLDGLLRNTPPQFSVWGQTAYNQRVLLQSPFDIKVVYPTNPPELLNVSAEVYTLSQVDSALIVQIVVVEKEIDGSAFNGVNLGNLKFKNVVKRMLPDAAGTRVNRVWLPSPIPTKFNQSWNPVNVYDKDKLGIVVFLQNEQNKQIYQSFYSDVSTRPSGITSLSNNLVQNFTLYPNPTKDKIIVGFEGITVTENYQIYIYDQLGRMCKEATLQSGNQGVVVNVENLADGMYVLKLQNSQGDMITRKFSIVK